MAKATTVKLVRRGVWKLVGDICTVILIAIVTTTFRKVVTPVHQGFQCHDPRLQQPSKPEAAISNGVLYGVGFGLPAAVMIACECVIVYKARKSQPNNEGQGTLLSSMIQKSFEAIVPFFFGGAVTHLTTNIPKYAIGRLRPNFFDVCKPDWNRVICDNGGYVTGDICTETSQKVIDKARVAFPSGHASLSMYFMLFLILYLQRRWTQPCCTLLRPLVQLILFYMALYCGLTRLSDHLHHWEDVFAGDILGAIIAVVVALKVRPVYELPDKKTEDPESPVEEPPEVMNDSLEEDAVQTDVEKAE